METSCCVHRVSRWSSLKRPHSLIFVPFHPEPQSCGLKLTEDLKMTRADISFRASDREPRKLGKFWNESVESDWIFSRVLWFMSYF